MVIVYIRRPSIERSGDSIRFPPVSKIIISKQSSVRKRASAHPVRDDPIGEEFPPLGEASVWDKPEAGPKDESPGSSPFNPGCIWRMGSLTMSQLQM